MIRNICFLNYTPSFHYRYRGCYFQQLWSSILITIAKKLELIILNFWSREPVEGLGLSRCRRADHDVEERRSIFDRQRGAKGRSNLFDRGAELTREAEHLHHPLVVNRRKQRCRRTETNLIIFLKLPIKKLLKILKWATKNLRVGIQSSW